MTRFAADILILALLAVIGEPAQDLTLSNDASGCEVARAAIDRVASSGVFKVNVNFMYHRVAMVSEFGANISVEGAFGIWQMQSKHLEAAKRALISLNVSLEIQRELCVMFETTSNDDLRKPLLNLITAALIIEASGELIPARNEIEAQADFWKAVFEVDIEVQFEMAATLLDKNKGEVGSWCLVCQDRPTDLIIVLDDSGSIDDDEWELQIQFVEKLLDSYHGTFDDKLTQVAMISFSSDITHEMGYTTSQARVDEYLNYKHEGGNTFMAQALYKAAKIIETHPRSRLDEVATKKMVLFITDGAALDTRQIGPAADNLKRLPISVYAIGTTNFVVWNQLEVIASDPNYVRSYDNYNDFSADIPSIIYGACQAGSITALSAGPNGSSEAEVTNATSSVSFVIPGIKVKDVRYFEFNFVLGSIAHVKLSPVKLDLVVYASFKMQFPSRASYDFKTDCKAGTECDIFVKDPDSFLNDICKAVKVEGGSDLFTTTVEAEGPDGETETEDVTMSITMKDDDPALWSDYQEEEEAQELKAKEDYEEEDIEEADETKLIQIACTEILRSRFLNLFACSALFFSTSLASTTQIKICNHF